MQNDIEGERSLYCEEEWRPIPSEVGYEVSNLGRVRSVDRVAQTSRGPRRYSGTELSAGSSSSGHLTVACGKGNSRSVHALVLEAFEGPVPEGMECLHRNDVPWDNRLENLRYGTRADNIRDAYENGGRQNLLTPEQVFDIRSRFIPRHEVHGATAMAKEFGVEPYIVHSCLSGKNYANG